jgi:uncharacterized protein YfaS (alpha-2-macroglobulin family)
MALLTQPNPYSSSLRTQGQKKKKKVNWQSTLPQLPKSLNFMTAGSILSRPYKKRKGK